MATLISNRHGEIDLSLIVSVSNPAQSGSEWQITLADGDNVETVLHFYTEAAAETAYTKIEDARTEGGGTILDDIEDF